MSNLARRWGLTEVSGYTPAAVLLTAFVTGIQLTLIFQALGDASYPPAGQGWLTWSTLAILLASIALHTPWARIQETASGGGLDELAEELKPNRHRQVLLAPTAGGEGRSASTPVPSQRTNGDQRTPEPVVATAPANEAEAAQPTDTPDASAEERPRLKARVHSPLAAGPVVKPGDDVPITVEAEPRELAEQLQVTITVDGPDGQRESVANMQGTTLVHNERFETAGTFDITITLDHPRADRSSKRIEGRVASYREEIARIFEELKDRSARVGLDVGPQSTPREVCRALRGSGKGSAEELASLAVELETALYGDQEVERSTYETVYTTVRRLRLDPQEVPG